jgi:hypothetical protein
MSQMGQIRSFGFIGSMSGLPESGHAWAHATRNAATPHGSLLSMRTGEGPKGDAHGDRGELGGSCDRCHGAWCCWRGTRHRQICRPDNHRRHTPRSSRAILLHPAIYARPDRSRLARWTLGVGPYPNTRFQPSNVRRLTVSAETARVRAHRVERSGSGTRYGIDGSVDGDDPSTGAGTQSVTIPGTYERFAQAGKEAADRLYVPKGHDFAWGGYFWSDGPGKYGFADLMHMSMEGRDGARPLEPLNRRWRTQR